MARVMHTYCKGPLCSMYIRQSSTKNFGFYKRSDSLRVDSSSTQRFRLGPQIRSFSVRSFLFGCWSLEDSAIRTSSTRDDFLFTDSTRRLIEEESSPRKRNWWQNGWQRLGSRRSKADTWTQNYATDNEVYCKAPKWKQIFWKLREETRQLNCAKQTPVFRYDSLGYAKNFDDWWKDLDYRQRAFPNALLSPMVAENTQIVSGINPTAYASHSIEWKGPLSSPEQANLSLWNRRKSNPTPSLDLNTVKI